MTVVDDKEKSSSSQVRNTLEEVDVSLLKSTINRLLFMNVNTEDMTADGSSRLNFEPCGAKLSASSQYCKTDRTDLTMQINDHQKHTVKAEEDLTKPKKGIFLRGRVIHLIKTQ